MTWSGLKGGLSIAMALSLIAPLPENQFVFMIYVIVIFSIIVQGAYGWEIGIKSFK